MRKNSNMKNRISFMGLFFLVQIFLLLFFIGQTIFLIGFYIKQIENSFIEDMRQTNIHAALLTKNAIEKNDYHFLTEAYISLINNFSQNTAIITEIFFLTKDGFIKAHNDFSEVSKKNSKYHNDYFQQTLQKQNEEIFEQDYTLANLPSPAMLPLVKKILLKEISYSRHFSTPIYQNQKAIGSVHVIANRNYLNVLMPMVMQNILATLLVVFIWGIFLSAILYKLFLKKLKNYQAKETEEQKTLQKPKEEVASTNELIDEKDAEDIVEAIFIED